jgi:hypothetical protein
MDTPVVVHLTSPDKNTSDVQLKDDGGPPDVTAGDGIWSGTIWSATDEFQVSLSAGSTEFKGGAVSWKPTDVQRDLSLSLGEGGLQAEAAVAQAMPAGSASPPSASALSNLNNPESPSGNATFSNSGGDSTLYVALGIGALMLAVIGYLWLRGRGPVALPAGMSLVPEPGLFGAGTPSLSEGLSLWVTSPNDASELARLLLLSLSRHHRVLVSAPARSPLPAVRGGPVYRIASGKSRQLMDAVDALHELNPGSLTVLMLGENLDARALKEHMEALPEGVGGVVILMEALTAALPTVHCQRREDHWLLRHGEIEVRVRESAEGFERI